MLKDNRKIDYRNGFSFSFSCLCLRLLFCCSRQHICKTELHSEWPMWIQWYFIL